MGRMNDDKCCAFSPVPPLITWGNPHCLAPQAPGLGARVIVTGASDSRRHPGGFAPHNRVGGPE